jgi:hypothetical protein
MPSTREPIHLLEPSNLLEPLDLAEQSPLHPWADSGDGTLRTRVTPTTSRTSRAEAAAPAGRGRRKTLKSVLLVAGALACFAAGASATQFAALVFDNRDRAQTIAAPPGPDARTTQPPKRAADPIHAPAEPKAAASSNPSIPTDATSNASNRTAATVKEPAAGNKVSCNPQALTDHNCAEAASPAPTLDAVSLNPPPAPVASQAATPQPADTERAAVRAASGQREERAKPAREKRRASRRDTANQRAAAASRTFAPDRDWAADDNAGRPWQHWEDRDAYRTSGWRRDWAPDDYAAGARPAGRGQAREESRESSWGRNRYDDYARGDAPTIVDRGWRGDDRATGRPSRAEAPAMMVPQFRGGW